VRVKGTNKALAMKADGNGRYGWLDPYEGARLAAAEACRNVVAAGAVPIGATNCLNFGNPERPEIMGQLVMAIRGIGDACRAFEVPITGGNVSLYNETDGQAIHPTPVLGVVGLIEDASKTLRSWFAAPGDAVFLLGETRAELGGSELVQVIHGRAAGKPPVLDAEVERRLHALVLEAAGLGLLRSAHDPSDGGLAVALAECAFRNGEPGVGGVFDLAAGLRPDVALFAESASRMVVSTRDEGALVALCARHGVPAHRLGSTGGDRLVLRQEGRPLVDASVSALHEAWMSLERLLSARPERTA
jgi:phosphoribosylformylglycinamidine synthase